MSELPPEITVTDPVVITVDGEELTVQKGALLIAACERHDIYIPRFCYHPRMSSVGMCRMCLVDVDTGRGPALQPSCMLEVTDGMVVETANPGVVKAQEGVLEYLLANHPLDCPVCDKGGECPLQDQTYSHGPGESRWVEEKRHYDKPIPISETIYLDRERCILCDRCTRFADEVAGDPLIHFMNRGAQTEINTFPDEPFASYFSGNTVQICPVGALTAKPYRFKARPWDLEEVESTCTRCSVGCRMIVECSRNVVLRRQGVDSDPVNWSWLCDKGRFGFEAYNDSGRLSAPLMRGEDGELAEVRWSDALSAVAETIRSAVESRGPSSVAVLGGARLTNEAQYAWTKLAKSVIGTDNVDAQMGDGLAPELVLGLPGASIDDVCAPGSTVLYLGPDPKEELPVLYLRLKHAALSDGVRLVELAPRRSGLTPYVTHALTCRPGEVAAVLSSLFEGEPTPEHSASADTLRGAGDRLFVVLGRPNLAESPDAIAHAVSVLQRAAPSARYLSALPRANIRGALETGMSPGLLPGGRRVGDGEPPAGWAAVPAEPGLDAAGILAAAAEGRIEVLVLLGADPLSDFPDRALARRALAGAGSVISVDLFVNASADRAAVVLAAAGAGEVDGTTTNLEGRVTRLNAKVTPPGTARPDWMLAVDIAQLLGADLGVRSSQDDLWAEMVAVSPAHDQVGLDALGVAPNGVLVDLSARDLDYSAELEVSPPDTYSLRLVVSRVMYDRGTLLEHSPSSSVLAGSGTVHLSPADAATMGIVDGSGVRLSSAHGGLDIAASVDSSLPKGTALMHHNLSDADPGVLLGAGEAVCDVRVEVL